MLQDGWEVQGLDLVPREYAYRLEGLKFDYRWGSCQDIGRLDVPYVVHCASQGDVPLALSAPAFTVAQNVDGTLAVLEAARRSDRLERFLLQSSEEVYGYCDRLPIKENEPLNPTNVYGASKAAQELLAMAYYHSYKLPVMVLRSSTIIGTGMRRSQVIPIFLDQALRGTTLSIQGDGSQTRDFNPVENHVDAILLALRYLGMAGRTINVGSGEERSIGNIAEECLRVTGSSSGWESLPWRPGEEGLRVALDITQARELLGYTPKLSFEESLERMAAWLAKELGVNLPAIARRPLAATSVL
jgi:dTDP-glucose 4,6-dehydratase